MAIIKPFAALRPRPDLAARICELPYDVVSSEEAGRIAAGNPLSFFHVSKPEIDLPPDTDPYSPEVYARGRENLDRLRREGALRQDDEACLYLYRQALGGHSQTGLVAVASCEDYLRGVVKKHELTRVDKEDDRVRHLEALNAQTGPAFLVHRRNEVVNEIVASTVAEPAEIDFTATDGVQHSAWVVRDADICSRLVRAFADLPALYIADGHHRSAAAARVCQSRGAAGGSAHFLAVIFPEDQVQILPYNRVLKDLNGQGPDALLSRLDRWFVRESVPSPVPSRKHQVSLYLRGQWHTLTARPAFTQGGDSLARLDVTLLQQLVLGPLFGIEDPRRSERIGFVGGGRGTAELVRLVDSGAYACAFAMYPTSIGDLMAIADAGAIMPPKSTWFEPKLRDAMFCHLL